VTESEKIEFLGGQVHALMGFAIAVITSHPTPAVLALHVDRMAEINLANAESTAVVETYIDGVLDVKDRLKSATEMVLGQLPASKAGD
jgi:hypothetical protein